MRRAAVFALGAILVTGCAGGDEPAPEPAASAAARWERIEPGGSTTCARGGPYSFWARAADPRRLVIFFQGGGGCFDQVTCAVGSSWFDDAVDASDSPEGQRGIFDFAQPRNPFRGWSFLLIPSCTGDVHIGDADPSYGSVKVKQRGWVNARAALDWAFTRFPDAEEILVTGCSAGSVGSAFHAPAVIARYPDARVTQLGDSLAFVFHRPISLVGWGAHDRFPHFFRIGSRRFTMVEYLTALAHRYPERVFARFNYASDDVQTAFYEALGGQPADFPARLQASEQRLMESAPNYRSFLGCGGRHCVLPFDDFYTLRVEGVGVRDWVAGLAAGRDVECPACRAASR